MLGNDHIFVIADIDGEPTIKRRRLATEVAEFGFTRLSYETREEAEDLLGYLGDDLRRRWTLQHAIRKLKDTNLGIVIDVVKSLKKGQTIVIQGIPNHSEAITQEFQDRTHD